MKPKINVAICQIPNTVEHSGNWNTSWEEYCIENNIDYQMVNPFDTDIIETLRNFDCVLWHFGQYNYQDMLVARSLLNSAHQMGLKVFPSYEDGWHFDDKIAETYLLQSVNAPIPKSEMFYSMPNFKTFIDKTDIFPLVVKLRCGSGSHNVKLLRNRSQALNYGKRMLVGKGFNPSPSLVYKTSSNIKSAKNWSTIVKRAKRIPEFLRTLSSAKEFPNEKRYVFLQDFIPSGGYDIKVVVVGDKLSFISRNIRSGEFRASGGGDLNYDRKRVTRNVIDSAFEVSDRLNFKCMGYDYVVDKNSSKGYIIEISYGFSHEALLGAGGYFNRDGQWIDEPLNAPKELLKNILEGL